MKRNKILPLLMAAVLSLTGCQLAKEDEVATGQDRLIGVFVTTEYLDLFDIEGYLKDNVNHLSDNMVIDQNDAAPYTGRIYAELETRTLTGENGEKIEAQDYVFPDLEGWGIMVPTTEYNGERCISSSVDSGISDVDFGISVFDDEEKHKINGTLYVSTNASHVTFYMNPVYQSPDGRVYVTSGSGISADMGGEGSKMTQTIDETVTIIEDGKAKKISFSSEISVAAVHPPVKINLLEMNSKNQVIRQETYQPDQVPDSLSPTPDTEYIIVETERITRYCETMVERQIVDPEDASMETFSCNEEGVCIKKTTTVQWEE